MRREQRLARIQKNKGFSMNEAVKLTDFSRGQLVKWQEAEIVKPYRHPAILYTWNQIIFLKVLKNLRNTWSFQQIETAIKNPDKHIDLDFITENVHNVSTIYFGEYGSISQGLKLYIQFNTLNTPNELEKKDVQKKLELFDWIIQDVGDLGAGKLSFVNVPKLVKELKQLANELQIENFDIKVS